MTKCNAISIDRSSKWTIERNEDEKHANIHCQILNLKAGNKGNLTFYS